MILLDSDHLTVLMLAEDRRNPALADRLEGVEGESVAVTVVRFLQDWEIVRFEEHAGNAFDRLRRHGVRIGTQDLKIASIALTNDALLLSANLRDFSKVPGLRVEDWLS